MNAPEYVRMLIKEKSAPVRVGLYGLGMGNNALLHRLTVIEGCELSIRSDVECISPVKDIPVFIGKDAQEIYEDVLILSPSVKRSAPHIKKAEDNGTIITSECDIFFMERVGTRFAVSGSDGKSSTVTLSAMMLDGAFDKVYTIGNIGVPYSLPPQNENYGYVCELSSFNLEYIKPETERCLITNISENHLNWHGSLDEYIRAKFNLFENAREVVLPADDCILSSFAKERNLFAVFSAKEEADSLKARFISKHFVYIKDGYIMTDGEPIIDFDSLGLKTEYAIKNALASVALTLGYAKKEVVVAALQNFKGLKHRCQLCHSGGGIDCFDSSIDTSPTRTASTLNSLKREVNIILGGQGKGLSMTPLIEPLRRYARSMAIYGEMTEDFLALIENDEVLRHRPHKCFPALKDAVMYLLNLSKRGDTILLSPACASYGEFHNFEERGLAFCKTVADYLNKE